MVLGAVSSPAEVHCATVFALQNGKFSTQFSSFHFKIPLQCWRGVSYPHISPVGFVPGYYKVPSSSPRMCLPYLGFMLNQDNLENRLFL